MDQSELKIRVVFASAGAVALCTLVASIFPAWAPEETTWLALIAPACALLISAAEALGLKKVASRSQARLLVSVLIGVCCLALLER